MISRLTAAPPSKASADVVSITANTGSDVLLPCSATGYPPPKVTWSPPVSGSSRHVTSVDGMTIKDVEVGDEATYTCEMTNVFGKSVHTVRLTVQGE